MRRSPTTPDPRGAVRGEPEAPRHPAPELPLAAHAAGLGRRFGWTWALRGIDLEIERGVTLVLVGPNGAGKTTLLRLLAGVLRPTRGSLRVLGHRIPDDAEAVRGRVGLLTGSGFLYPELTAAENLRFAARMAGAQIDRSEMGRVLARVGLADVADRRNRALSSGMNKRLALARLLILPLDLVLLDEPYAGLDTEGQRLVDSIIADFRKKGCTVVIASHQAGEAVRLAERSIVLARGRIAPMTRPSEACAPHEPGAPERAGGPGRRGAPAGAGTDTPPLAPSASPAPSVPPQASPPPIAGLAARAGAIVWKDLLTEARTKQSLGAMVFFAGLVLFIFSFALGPDTELLRRTAGGLLWTGIAFTGILSLSRTYQAEEASGGIEGLRAYAGDVRAIYLGKLAGNLILLGLVEIVLFPAAGILFQVELLPHALPLAGVALLGTLGFSLVGTLYAALAVHLRAREIMLPLLLFPALVPVLLGAVNATTLILAGDPLGHVDMWVRLLIAFDVIFLVVCTWIFPVVIEE